MKTFEELVKGTTSEKESELPKHDLKDKSAVMSHVKIISDTDSDDHGCDGLLGTIMKALGLPTHAFSDFRPDRLPGLLGGDSEIIISMGGPEIAYSEGGMSDMFKDIIKMIDSHKEYSKDDIKEIRRKKASQGASMKKMLALMDDDKVLKAFNGMLVFKAGGDLNQIQYAKQGRKIREAISGELITLPDNLDKDLIAGKKVVQTIKGDGYIQGNQFILKKHLKKPIGIKADGGNMKFNDLNSMSTVDVTLGNKRYKLYEATSMKEKMFGLMGVENLPEDEGMIFYYDEPLDADIWMKNTKIPLDIIFINEDFEVITVKSGHPLNESHITCPRTCYVVELNANSDVKPGDRLDLPGDDDEYVMQVLGSDGEPLMGLHGGERIFSRKNTRMLIKWAKRSYRTKDDRDYKHLGKLIFKYLNKQDTNKPEYVEAPR